MGNTRKDSGTRPQKKRAPTQQQFDREMDRVVDEEQLYYDALADYYDKETDTRDQPTQRKKRKTTPESPKKYAMTQKRFNHQMNQVVQLNYDDLDDELKDLLYKQHTKFSKDNYLKRRDNMTEAQKQREIESHRKRRDNMTEAQKKRHNVLYPERWRSTLSEATRRAVNKAARERRVIRKDPSRKDSREVSYRDYM